MQNKLEEIEKNILYKEDIYKKRENEDFDDCIAMQSKDLFLKSILDEIKRLNIKKRDLEEILEYKKDILSTILGEKKAFNSYLEKQEIKKAKEESENENRLANEIFVRKFYNN